MVFDTGVITCECLGELRALSFTVLTVGVIVSSSMAMAELHDAKDSLFYGRPSL